MEEKHFVLWEIILLFDEVQQRNSIGRLKYLIKKTKSVQGFFLFVCAADKCQKQREGVGGVLRSLQKCSIINYTASANALSSGGEQLAQFLHCTHGRAALIQLKKGIKENFKPKSMLINSFRSGVCG